MVPKSAYTKVIRMIILTYTSYMYIYIYIYIGLPFFRIGSVCDAMKSPMLMHYGHVGV